MKKGYTKSRNDGVGSQITEEIFVYAHCENIDIEYIGCVDNRERDVRDGEEGKYNVHHNLLKMLNLPNIITNTKKCILINSNNYSLKIYPNTNEFINSEFINKIRSRYTYDINNDDNIYVAVHIRRGNVKKNNSLRYISNNYYLNLIKKILKLYPKANIEVFTQKDKNYNNHIKLGLTESFKKFSELGCKVFINSNIKECWKKMISADIFIMAKSGFSWVPAIYNKNCVIYYPAWYQKLNHWHNSNNPNLMKEIEKILKDKQNVG